MSTWIIWTIIILAYVGFRKINTEMEKMNDQQPNADFPPPPPAEAYDDEPVYTDVESALPPSPPRSYSKPVIPNIPTVEGGRLKVEVLDEDDDTEVESEADEAYSAENIRERIRDGVVLKEIIDRKYF